MRYHYKNYVYSLINTTPHFLPPNDTKLQHMTILANTDSNIWQIVDLSKPIVMSALFNFLHQSPQKFGFSDYFLLKISPLIDALFEKCQHPWGIY